VDENVRDADDDADADADDADDDDDDVDAESLAAARNSGDSDGDSDERTRITRALEPRIVLARVLPPRPRARRRDARVLRRVRRARSVARDGERYGGEKRRPAARLLPEHRTHSLRTRATIAIARIAASGLSRAKKKPTRRAQRGTHTATRDSRTPAGSARSSFVSTRAIVARASGGIRARARVADVARRGRIVKSRLPNRQILILGKASRPRRFAPPRSRDLNRPREGARASLSAFSISRARDASARGSIARVVRAARASFLCLPRAISTRQATTTYVDFPAADAPTRPRAGHRT